MEELLESFEEFLNEATSSQYTNKDTQWETLVFKGKFTTFNIESAGSDGDVEFEMLDGNEALRAFLTKEDIKILIAHLQKQLKTKKQ